MWWKRLLRKLAVSESSSSVSGAFAGTAAAVRSDAHRFAHAYWQNCSDTFLASDPSYYDRQESELRRILADRVGRVRSALDIGCGNGRFSFVLAEVSDSVLAFDLSTKLIAEATANAERRKVEGMTFQVRDLEAGVPAGPFDLVACMGVISTLIDDVAYNALIDDLERSVVTSGYVLTKDTLSTVEEGRLVITDTYVTNYRNVSAYEQAFARRGLRFVDQARLATLEGMINNLYLWQKE
jgi:SAM-dependent methyltransferase